MAVIEVTCPNPNCGARLKAPAERAGKKAKCSKCHETVRIPGPGQAAEPIAPEPDIPMALAVPDEEDNKTDRAPKRVPAPEAELAPPTAPVKNQTPALLDLPQPVAKPAKPASGAVTAVPAAKPVAPTAAPKADTPAPVAKAAPPAKPVEPVLEPLPDEDEVEPPKSKPKAKAKKAAALEPEPTDNPFSFGFTNAPEPAKTKKSKLSDENEKDTKTRDAEGTEEKPPKKHAAEAEPEREPEDKPRYKRPAEKGGMGKAIAISAGVALIAITLAAAAGVMYVRSNRTEEVKKEEKKEEPPAPVVAPPVVPPQPVASKDKAEPKPKDKEPEPKPKDPAPAPASPRQAAILDGKFKSITVGKEPTKFEPADRASEPRFVVDTAFAAVVQVFPPFDPKTSDAYLVTRAGARFSLDAFSPSSGKRVSQLDFAADPKPVCDVHVTATESRFLAVSAGRVTVWDLADQKKLVESIDPYADKPDHAKNGLAAAFFTPQPDQIVTVSTAGAVNLFDLSTKTVVSEFVPPHGVKGAVAPGESVARADPSSIALAVGGIVYQIKSAPGLDRVRTHDIGGDVKPLAIAASGAPGRLVFAFEAEFKGKKGKERALLALPIKGDQRSIFLLPAATGTPKGAFCVHDTEFGIVTDRGVVWFGEDESMFGPVVVTRPVADGLYAGSGAFFWYVVPRPSNAAQSVLVPLAVPFGDAAEFRGSDASKPLRVVRIDQNGLAK